MEYQDISIRSATSGEMKHMNIDEIRTQLFGSLFYMGRFLESVKDRCLYADYGFSSFEAFLEDLFPDPVIGRFAHSFHQMLEHKFALYGLEQELREKD